MILYADSGSTKTEWILVKNKKIIFTFNTIGMNPFFVSEKEIFSELDKEFNNYSFKEIKELHFFGAGCSNKKKSIWLKKIFQKLFVCSNINIRTDIELAVLSVVEKGEESIVSILGTGSSFRVFDGKNIIKRYSSLGYIVGDEGSGTHISKELLRRLYYNQMPGYINQFFFDEYNMQLEEIMDNIYSKPFPNRFLAQFTTFCSEYIYEPEIEQIVIDSFYSFFKTHILYIDNYTEHSLHFIGSIAFHFQEQLHLVANEFDCEIGIILKKPLENLILKK